jgi:hypothetical protein
VNKRGKGVGEAAGVEVGSGVGVAGTGVGEAGVVEVGKKEGAGVAVAGWQAVMRIRHPMRRSFFMAPIKTQLPGALFQAIVFKKHNTLCN